MTTTIKFGDRKADEIVEILDYLIKRTGSRHFRQRQKRYIKFVERSTLRFLIRFQVKINDDDLAAEVYLKFF